MRHILLAVFVLTFTTSAFAQEIENVKKQLIVRSPLFESAQLLKDATLPGRGQFEGRAYATASPDLAKGEASFYVFCVTNEASFIMSGGHSKNYIFTFDSLEKCEETVRYINNIASPEIPVAVTIDLVSERVVRIGSPEPESKQEKQNDSH